MLIEQINIQVVQGGFVLIAAFAKAWSQKRDIILHGCVYFNTLDHIIAQSLPEMLSVDFVMDELESVGIVTEDGVIINTIVD